MTRDEQAASLRWRLTAEIIVRPNRARVLAALLLVLIGVHPQRAHARADVRGIVTGSGFQDRTPVEPVGGNPGTTLGEQRRRAMERAFADWSKRLDSDVPIEVAFELEALGCMNGGVVLGGAAPVSAFGDVPGGEPGMFYVSALANSLAGRDLDPTEPDIIARFNSSVDRECRSGTGGFYYGFDGKSDDAVDFIQVVLHELAHGLGISSLIDVETGESVFPEGVDSYTARLRDLSVDRPWSQLTAAERRLSAGRARGVVWDGPEAAKLAQETFAPGAPTLSFQPEVSGLSDAVSDVAFAHSPAQHPVTGPLLVAPSCVLNAATSGSVVLFPSSCEPRNVAMAAQAAGAAGALLVAPWPFDTPAMPLDMGDDDMIIELPMLSIAVADAALVRRRAQQSALQVTLGGNAAVRFGADARGRPLLFASQPASSGSTISHLEQVVRPNQLMEPYATRDAAHGLGFTVALLRDIGWELSCGDGQQSESEQCDDGDANSDAQPGACRSDCSEPRCGDGVKDDDEECDSPIGNDDSAANACRAGCRRAHCGDGVVDRGEECDRGADNDDKRPNACRKSCKLPRCGDAIVDALEDCDEGQDNSDKRANACRISCKPARCGDSVIDEGEACDEGRANSDTRADACRLNCEQAHCGDGVRDQNEACDSDPECTESCRPLKAAPSDNEVTPGPGNTVAADGGIDASEPAGSCGCRITSGARDTSSHTSAVCSFVLVTLALTTRMRRRRDSRETRRV